VIFIFEANFGIAQRSEILTYLKYAPVSSPCAP